MVLALDLERWTAAQITGLATSLMVELHDATPRDTGHARSNWVGSVGGPEGGVVGSKQSVDNGRYLSSLATLGAWEPASSPQVSITNNVPYIGRLNSGWSSQAPAGFIELAVARAQEHGEWPIKG